MRAIILTACGLLALAPPALAADPPPAAPAATPAMPPVKALTAEERRQLAERLRLMLLDALPEPIAVHEHHWGQQRNVLVGVKWRGARPERQYALRNDGNWQRLTVVPVNPAESLTLTVTKVETPAPGRSTFEAVIGLDVHLTHVQQGWKSGAKLTQFETTGRCRAELRVGGEVTSRFDRAAKPLPALVVRVRVTEADLAVQDIVCERVARLDGKAAKLAGDALRAFVGVVKPGLEERLLEKADAAIVKAADSREVRLGLEKLAR